MADVFVSYATKDRERVKPIVEATEAAGYSVWWDRRIELGSSFDREIERELDSARCVIVVWSTHSVDSDWVRNEAQEGLDRGVLVPLLIDDVKPPLAFRRAQTALLSDKPSSEELGIVLTAVESAIRSEQANQRVSSAVQSRDAVAAGRPLKSRRAANVGIAALLLVIVSGLFWWYGFPSVQDSSKQDRPAEIAKEITTIAVAPFEDSSPDSDMRWLAAGLAAQLRNQLARIEGLSIVPPGATASAQLGGTVQASTDEVVVLMEMTDPASGITLWAQTFTGSAEDPIEMQERVLLQIVRVLERRLIAEPKQPRGQAAQIAWLRYLAGGWGGDTVTQKYWLEQVVAEDPEYAPAYVVLYWTYSQYARAYAQQAWVAKATDALDRAEELGLGDDPGWLLAKGSYLWQFAGEFEQAEAYMRRALLAGGPGHGYAQWMMASGLVREARDYMEQLAGSWPYLPTIWAILSFARGLEGDVAGAYEAGQQASKLLPPDMVGVTSAGELWALPRLGRLEEAENELEDLQARYVRLQRFPELRLVTLLLESDIALARGEREQAAEVAATLESEGWHQIAGILYSKLDDDRASGALEAGAQSPHYRLAYLQAYLMHLTPAQRKDPRVRRMLNAMGFTHEWRLELCRLVSTLPQDKGLTCDPLNYQEME